MVELWRHLDEHLRGDGGAVAHVASIGHHRLMVEDPLRLMLEERAWVRVDHLLTLHGEVVLPPLVNMRALHEEAFYEALADGYRESALLQRGCTLQELAFPQDAIQLLRDALRLLHATLRQEIVLAELRLRVSTAELREGGQQRKVVPQPRGERLVGPVRCLLCPPRPLERWRHGEHGDDDRNLLAAAALRGRDDGAAEVRVHRELRHVLADLRQLALVVHGAKEVQHLEGTHHRLGRGRLHVIEVHDVVYAQLLERQHHGAQVAADDLGVCALGQLLLVAVLRVEAEALPRARPPCTTRALHCARLRDRRDQQRIHMRPGVVQALLEESRIYDIDHAVDRERGLGDVCGDDHLAHAFRGQREDLPLLLHRQRGVERQHHELAAGAFILRQLRASPLDLLLARQEQ
mmetsp:Transcript_52506/g.135533  ORF Transcript_52506/g.135533 Transcript_52506/m.135533 type:complete len:406 (+) Transcript_52506:150-1367(+)